MPPAPHMGTPTLSGYALIISEATGEKDRAVLKQIEDIMRDVIYHSTLDWQTRAELTEAAREANEVRKLLPAARGQHA